MKNKANEKLDTTQSYKKQKSADITAICVLVSISEFYQPHNTYLIQAKRQYPIVSKYDNYWPIRDMIKLHLKYASETFRKQGKQFRRVVRS